MPYRRVTALLALLALAPAAPAQDCFGDLFCVEADARGDSVHVVVDNRSVIPVVVRFAMTLRHLHPDRPLPLVAGFPGRRRTRALTLLRERPDGDWGYRYRITWVPGTLEARHDDAHVYALPYARGTAHRVGQGYDGATSHRGQYAIDWDMPTGTPVMAARDGLVIAVTDTFSVGGPDPALLERANVVRVLHADGTIGAYVHLMRGGGRVQVGQRVRRGDVLALSGATGYATGPHLHFEVYTLDRDLKRKTLPVRFAVAGHPGGIVLEEGRTYRR